MCSVEMSSEKIFEQNKSETHITEHYVFHYQAGSLAEKEIQQIAETQEKAFTRICNTLQVDYPERIHYYFSESPLEIGRVFWNEGTPCNGCAVYGENKIYAVYSEKIKCIGEHEDTHLIAYLIGWPMSDFIVEGLATFFHEKWWGVPNEIWTSYYKSKHTDLSVKVLLDNDVFAEYGDIITYPVAGAFTKFLIDTYGIDKYIELYRYDGCEYEEIIHSIYSTSLSELETMFWKKMSKIAFDAVDLEEMLKNEGF